VEFFLQFSESALHKVFGYDITISFFLGSNIFGQQYRADKISTKNKGRWGKTPPSFSIGFGTPNR
jgi:hypothetical protein